MALPSYTFYRSNFIFFLALICGALLPQGFRIGNILILPALIVIITITLLRFPRGFFRHMGSLMYSSIQGNIMNYLVLGNFILLAGAFLIQKQELWIGMVLVATMPSSLDIITLGNLMQVEKNYIFTSLAGTYLGSLLIAPLVGLCFLKYIHLNYWNIILVILGLIFLPLILSRIIIEKDWDQITEKNEATVTDYCYFIVFYAITANSRIFLMNWLHDIFFIALIAFTSTFLFYFLIRKIGFYLHEEENKINFFILLGTMKNCGLAGGIALIVFSPESAIPPLIFAVFTFIYMNWIKYKTRHITKSDNVKET
jgi:bile acid:Na+ symporter, BASS family